jgi:hypothetical protein
MICAVLLLQSDDDDSDEMVEDLESDLEELENNKFFTEFQLAFFGGLQLSPLPTRFPEEPFILALQKIDFEEVKTDISAMLVDSQDFWPADYGTYGAFFIHLAWHCSATYRTFDGRGGCEGGRPRFEPERSMEENVNKDKAWLLLKKIKDKYGTGSHTHFLLTPLVLTVCTIRTHTFIKTTLTYRLHSIVCTTHDTST